MIHIERPVGAWLWYHVLSHLDLGRDAANIHRPDLPPKPWAETARAAVLADPNLQFTPLISSEIEDLRRTPLRLALDAEEPVVVAAWTADDAVTRHRRFFAEVAPDLNRARKALGAGLLVIYDIPALGPHARALTRKDGRRIVATDLNQPADHVFCQILHEEIHPYSDRIIRPVLGNTPRDTRPGTPGWNVHQALEVAAIEGMRQIIERHTAHRTEDYTRWCQRFGVGSAAPSSGHTISTSS